MSDCFLAIILHLPGSSNIIFYDILNDDIIIIIIINFTDMSVFLVSLYCCMQLSTDNRCYITNYNEMENVLLHITCTCIYLNIHKTQPMLST